MIAVLIGYGKDPVLMYLLHQWLCFSEECNLEEDENIIIQCMLGFCNAFRAVLEANKNNKIFDLK